MIGNIIIEYLINNKRLVIPGFGTFIRKDTGGVVFVELLKKDDQILTSLLRKQYSIDESKAHAITAKFISEAVESIDANGWYVIEGLGIMRKDGNGVYELEHNPSARISDMTAETQPASAPDNHSQKEAKAQAAGEPVSATKTEHLAPRQTVAQKTADHTDKPKPAGVHAPSGTTGQESAYRHGATKPETKSAPNMEQAEAPDTGYAADKKTVKDLRYQKPAKPSDYKKKKRADVVMIIAVIAALVAIASMVFGLLVKDDPVDNLRPTQPIENTEAAPADTTTVE